MSRSGVHAATGGSPSGLPSPSGVLIPALWSGAILRPAFVRHPAGPTAHEATVTGEETLTHRSAAAPATARPGRRAPGRGP